MLQEFGKRLEKIRKLRGLSQEELTYKVGRKSKSSVYDWEIGKSSPRLEAFYLLAKELNVSADYLLGLTNNQVNLSCPQHRNYAQSSLPGSSGSAMESLYLKKS